MRLIFILMIPVVMGFFTECKEQRTPEPETSSVADFNN